MAGPCVPDGYAELILLISSSQRDMKRLAVVSHQRGQGWAAQRSIPYDTRNQADRSAAQR